MAMLIEDYNKIEQTIKNHRGLSKDCAKALISTFPNIKPNTLRSILAHYHRFKIVKPRLIQFSGQLIKEYYENIKQGSPPGILLRLSVKYDFLPTTVARVLIEDYIKKSNDLSSNPATLLKSKINKYLKDTTLINDMNLAHEAYLCVLNDDQSGSISDAIKHSIGLEYEMKLGHLAKENGMIFKSEANLRKDGYDKTPDIKLDVPVAVNGFVISWIESKALFGNPVVHQGYMKDQYISYWNRFGPGLIIYWFGYLETIVNPSERRFIISDDFPQNITLMNPKSIEINLNKVS